MKTNTRSNRKERTKYSLRFATLALHQADLQAHSTDKAQAKEGKKFFNYLRANKQTGLTKEQKKDYLELETRLKKKRIREVSKYMSDII